MEPLTSKIIKILLFSLGGQLFRCLLLSHQWIGLILGQLFNNFLLLLYIVLKTENRNNKKLTKNSIRIFISNFSSRIFSLLFLLLLLLEIENEKKKNLKVQFMFFLKWSICLLVSFDVGYFILLHLFLLQLCWSGRWEI